MRCKGKRELCLIDGKAGTEKDNCFLPFLYCLCIVS